MAAKGLLVGCLGCARPTLITLEELRGLEMHMSQRPDNLVGEMYCAQCKGERAKKPSVMSVGASELRKLAKPN